MTAPASACAGYVHLHPGAPPVAVSNSTTKAEQRHSDPGAALPKASDPGADILSGNLEQLSQQLQSATAMFNSQSAPSTSRGFGNSGQAESGPHAGKGLVPWEMLALPSLDLLLHDSCLACACGKRRGRHKARKTLSLQSHSGLTSNRGILSGIAENSVPTEGMRQRLCDPWTFCLSHGWSHGCRRA